MTTPPGHATPPAPPPDAPSSAEAPRAESPRALEIALPLLFVAVAVALRAWHVGWGLPDLDEPAIPLRLALAMRSLADGHIDPHPPTFADPSLGLYLHLAVQQLVYLAGAARGLWAGADDHRLAFELDPTPMVLAARTLAIACDALAVIAAWRIGRRVSRAAGALAAALVAGSGVLITTARGIQSDSLMIVLALWALERMLAWHACGGRGRRVVAALLIGLAAGTRYPAFALLVPFGALAWARLGRRAVRPMVLAASLALLAFLATTPYALLDSRGFARDLAAARDAIPPGVAPALPDLAHGLGAPVLLLLLLAPLVAWRDRARRAPLAAMLLALAAFALPLTWADARAPYALPATVAVAAPLVALTFAALVTRLAARPRTVLTTLAFAALVLPAATAGVAAARRGAHDTRGDARRWCEAHLGADRLVVTEAYGPRLADGDRVAELRETAAYRLASPAWRARVDHMPVWRVVTMPIVTSGPLENPLRLAGLPPVTLKVAPDRGALGRAYYEPALVAGADWIIVTGAVRDRALADPGRYVAESRFYHTLDRDVPVAARFRPGADGSGTEIVVYRVDDAARARLTRRGALDPLWWTAAIPDAYRRDATRLLDAERHVRDSLLTAPAAPPRRGVTGALAASPRPLAVPELPGAPTLDDDAPAPGPRDESGDAAPWVRSLRPMYEQHLAGLAGGMSRSLAVLGRYDAAARLAEANLVMIPEDVPSCLVASVSLSRMQDWLAARATLERTLAVLDPERPDPVLELQYARVLARTGDAERAREIDRRLVARLPAADPLARAAAADLAALP